MSASSTSRVQRLLASADAVALDVDGVLCLEDQPIQGAAEAYGVLRRRVLKVVAATNDSRRSRTEQLRRLASVGLLEADGLLVTCADATVAALRRDGHRHLEVVGSAGLLLDLEGAGCTFDGEFATALVTGCVPDLKAKEAEVVTIARRVRNLPWYATNDDAVIPGCTRPLRDAGAVIDVVAAQIGGQPIVCGKPSDLMTGSYGRCWGRPVGLWSSVTA